MVVTTHTKTSGANDGMQIKTILNRIQKQRGFVYGAIQLEAQIGGLAVTVEIAPHRRNRPRCAGCAQPAGCTTAWLHADSSSSRSGACACSFST
jgi:hypothetical protein